VTNVVGTTGSCPAANQTNDATRVTALSRLTNNIGAGPCLGIVPLPILTKSFGANPQTIGVGQTATLTFTINNTAVGAVNRTALGFTDTLPGAGALTATTTTPQCGGGTVTVTGVNNNIITVSGASVNAGLSCTITATVTGVTAGSYVNGPTNSSITGVTANLTNSVTDQTLNVRQAGLTKAYGAASIDDGGSTSLVYTLTNGVGNPAQSGLGFTETLPSNLRFNAASQNVTYGMGCSGPATVTATGGPPLNTFSIAGVAMTGGTASCTVTVSGVTNVVGTTGSCPAANQTNDATRVTALSRLTNNIGAGPCLGITSIPTLTKAFSATNIALNGSVTLTFTVTNNASGSVARSGLGFVDELPSGLTLGSATLGTNTCGMTLQSRPTNGSGVFGAATAGHPSIQLSGGSVAINSTCVTELTITGATSGAKVNGAANVTNIVGTLTNAVTNQTVNVYAPPTLAKAFGSNFDTDGSTTLTFTLNNPAGNPGSLTGINFNDILPTAPGAMTVFNATTTNTCGGTLEGRTGVGAFGAVTAGNTEVRLTGVTLAAGANCTASVTVTSAVAGSYTNTTTAPAATGPVAVTGVAATAMVSVLPRPALTKSFGANPQTIGVGQTATLTFTIDNTAVGAVNRTALGFTDTLPSAGALTATTTTPQCGGGTVTVTGVNNNIITVSGASVNAGLSCTITATVTGVTAGSYVNGPTNSSITGVTANLVNNVTDQTLHVRQASVAKTFGAASINDGAATTLIFTLTNGAGNPAQSGIALGDTLPNGLRFSSAAPAVAYSMGCSGPAMAAYDGMTHVLSGLTGISMSGGTASCTVTVSGLTNTATQTNASCAMNPPLFTNLAANVTTTRATNSSTDQCLVVNLVSPTLTKTWATTPINDGSATNLVYTLTNSGTNPAQSGIAFTDQLPASLRLTSATPTITFGAGCAGTGTPTVGMPDSLAFTGVTMTAATASCTITVTAVTNRTGLVNPSCSGNPAAFTNGAANISGLANLTNGVTDQCLVVNTVPPVLTKAWGAPTITDGASTTLIFTLTNQGTNPAQSGVAFTESLPTGLRFTGATPTVGFSAGCSGSSVVTQGSPDTIAFSGVALTNGTATCTITVTGVTNRTGQVNASCMASPAAFTNNASRISATTNLTNSVTPQCLTVATQAPTIAKSFVPATIAAGAPTTMSFVITNPNSVALTSANFTDTLSNIRVSGAQTVTGCSGSNSFTNNQTGLLSFTGLTIPANGNCTVSVTVTSNTPGMLPNTSSGVASADAPTGVASNTATLTVNAVAPTITKAFVTPSISLGGTSQVDFNITNPNAIPLTGAAFSDTLSDMFINATGAATGTCTGAGTNSFTVNQTGLLNFTGLTIPASGACTVSIVIRSNTPGTHPNFATGVSSNEAPTGANSATVNLMVTAAAPSISKAFTPATIASGGTSTLTVTINNPNAGPITVTSVTDAFPTSPGTGLVRATTPNASTTCTGGMVTSTSGSVTLTGGTVPASGSCTFQIDVTAATAGTYSNTIAIGALTTNAGSNAAAANANLTVTPVANVSVAKSGPATVPWGTTITYTVVVSNAGPDGANLTAFTDNVPAAITGVGATCGTPTMGAVCGSVSVAGNSVTSTITTLPAGGSVTFTITGTAPQTGTLANFATAIVPMGVTDPDDPGRTGAGNNTSNTVMTTVVAPDLRITKSATPSAFIVGSNASYTLTPTNTGSAASAGTITVVDTLPTGLTYVAMGSGGTGWSCTPSGQVITCTSASVIAAMGMGNTITINVSVADNAVPSVSNVATIAGGNEPAANSGNNATVLNTNVTNSAVNTFLTDGTQTGIAGSSVLFTHTFNAALTGNVAFTTTHNATPNIPGWTNQIYRDNNCNGILDGVDGATDITAASIAVTPGQQVCIVVKSNIPAAAPGGAQDIILATATFTPMSGPVVTYTRTDITTVGGGTTAGLVLMKSVRNVTQGGAVGTSNSARPGDVLEYVITYTNSSASAILTTINLADVTPAFTTFVSAGCMVMPYPNNITACSVTTAPSVGGMGAIQWQLTGSLAPSRSGFVVFRVTVQ
jgi:uncharacterized repeat protein (TIGR01451 family)